MIPRKIHHNFAGPDERPKGRVELDRSNPFGKIVSFATALNYDYSDLASGDVPALNKASTDRCDFKPEGFEFLQGDYGNGAGRNSLRYAAKVAASGQDLTVLVKFKGNGLNGIGARIIDTKALWSATEGFYISHYSNSSSLRIRGSGGTERTLATVENNGWVDVAVVYSGANVTVYSHDGSSTSASIDAVSSIGTEVTLAHNTGDNEYPFGGIIAHCLIAPVALGKTQTMRWLKDPYQVLKPSSKLFIVPSTGVGAFTLVADSGAYSVAGSTAELIRDKIIVAATGSYSVSGAVVALTFAGAGSFTLTANTASYAVAGSAASLVNDSILISDTGGYAVSGSVAALSTGFGVAADSGGYSISGTIIGIDFDSVLASDAGSYVMSGGGVSFSFSGEALWEIQPIDTTVWTIN